MADWEEILDKYSLMIEQKVSTFMKKELEEATDYHDFMGRLYQDVIEYMCRGGKRLASSSTLLIYKGFTSEIDDRILDVCAGMEIYRHAILIHDDLVDEDELRRGEKTIHTIYSQKYDTRFGQSIAVFTGNILYTLALKVLSRGTFESQKIMQITHLLNDGFQAVNESQILDLLFEYKIPDVDEWYIMASKRAASLFKASLQIGAVLADASERDVQLIRKTGDHIGYCFDIQDDIIDTYASQKEYGRIPGTDLTKHKKPLHIVCTYLKANPSQLEEFKKTLETDSIDKLPLIKKMISETGALDEAKNHSINHADQAKQCISETSMNWEIKDFFISFIDYIKDSLTWYK
jgi:geranylgeranyl pyrophosphate synthase